MCSLVRKLDSIFSYRVKYDFESNKKVNLNFWIAKHFHPSKGGKRS